MSQEILFKSDHDAEGQVITVEDREISADRGEADGRYSVTAYVKTENGNTSMHSPTFLIQHTQRVPVTMKKKGKKARIFHATLFNDEIHVAIRVPPEGGTFDLIPGYWGMSITGSYVPPGGIFATVLYNNALEEQSESVLEDQQESVVTVRGEGNNKAMTRRVAMRRAKKAAGGKPFKILKERFVPAGSGWWLFLTISF